MNRASPRGLPKAVRKIGLLVSAGGLVSVISVVRPYAQQTGPPPQSAPQEVLRPPLPNRVNEILPGWLRVRGEFRDRMEGFTNAGFTSGRDDLYWLNRFRFNATIQPSRLLAFSVQAQDARVQKKTIGSTGPPFRDVFDLRMAFADVGDPQHSPFLIRVGRQELAFGEQRLVGHLSWLNTARTFDAVRLTIHRKEFQVDAFGSSVVTVEDAKFNRSGFGSRFFGAYGSTAALIPQSTLEPYVFYRLGRGLKSELGPVSDLKAATIGARWAGTLPARLDYGIEVAVQTGSLGPDTVQAWAGHWQVRDTLSTKHGLRVVGEYNYASGDSDPLDGSRETFDQLYPTGHDKYGLADQVGWRNIHHLRSGVEGSPRKGLVVNGNYHSWWLAEPRDGLYNAAGAVIARVPGGAADRHVGQEIDAQASYALSAQVQVAGGYAYIFPGRFLKQATPGSAYSYPYVMVTYIFLAER
jgi:Alginate export